MNVAAIGDSHSSLLCGKSWPDFLTEKYGWNLIRASSSGAGNSFYIEKLHYILKYKKPDLVVIQLTSPNRIVLGMESTQTYIGIDDLNSGQKFNDINCYTWNHVNNEKNFKNQFGLDTKIDELWINHIATSRWIDYKAMQDIYIMQSLCKEFNTPFIVWSWFATMESHFIPEYTWLKEKFKWVPGCAHNWLQERKHPYVDGGHYGPDSHKELVDNWLAPELNKLL